ncbi:MAG: hypothetical protein RR369_05495 [Lachnospiraceae bacterium]
MYEIKITSTEQAKEFAKSGFKKPTIIIGICNPYDLQFIDWRNTKNAVDVLRLLFRDNEGDSGMTENDAERVADFVTENMIDVKSILVYCTQGVSRSAGVAAAIGRVLNKDDSFVFSDASYCPNMRCYAQTAKKF